MASGDVIIPMNYSKEAKLGTKPYKFTYERTPEEIAKSHLKIDHDLSQEIDIMCTIRDARGLENEITLDKQGFQLVNFDTAIKTDEFYDSEYKLNVEYAEEMKELIKKTMGCEYVHIFHTQVRNKDRVTKTKDSGDRCKVHQYAGRIHNDYHAQPSKDIYAHVAQTLPKKYHKGRFCFVNVWRNISDEPVGNDTMTFCDETSLAYPDDVIAADYYDRLFPVQHYRLIDFNAHRHRWYYFSQLRKEECLVFKQWDSDVTKVGRMAFHTSFHNPNAPECAPRESVETRALAFFPDHEPNTCPYVEPVGAGEEKKEDVVEKSMNDDYSFMDTLEENLA